MELNGTATGKNATFLSESTLAATEAYKSANTTTIFTTGSYFQTVIFSKEISKLCLCASGLVSDHEI